MQATAKGNLHTPAFSDTNRKWLKKVETERHDEDEEEDEEQSDEGSEEDGGVSSSDDQSDDGQLLYTPLWRG